MIISQPPVLCVSMFDSVLEPKIVVAHENGKSRSLCNIQLVVHIADSGELHEPGT